MRLGPVLGGVARVCRPVASPQLKKSKQEREAYRKGSDLRTDAQNLADPDDRNMLRGENQESEHHKRRADD